MGFRIAAGTHHQSANPTSRQRVVPSSPFYEQRYHPLLRARSAPEGKTALLSRKDLNHPRLIRIDEGWEWDFDALKDAMVLLANTHPDETQRNRVACIYTLNNNIRKWTIEGVDPQRAPYSQSTEDGVRRFANRSGARHRFTQ